MAKKLIDTFLPLSQIPIPSKFYRGWDKISLWQSSILMGLEGQVVPEIILLSRLEFTETQKS